MSKRPDDDQTPSQKFTSAAPDTGLDVERLAKAIEQRRTGLPFEEPLLVSDLEEAAGIAVEYNRLAASQPTSDGITRDAGRLREAVETVALSEHADMDRGGGIAYTTPGAATGPLDLRAVAAEYARVTPSPDAEPARLHRIEKAAGPLLTRNRVTQAELERAIGDLRAIGRES